MYVCSYPTVPKHFLVRICKKIIEYLSKTFYVSLGTATSCIYRLKRQRFLSSVPFNVIEMVHDFNVSKFD